MTATNPQSPASPLPEAAEPVAPMDDDELQDFCISLSFDQDDYTVDVIRNVERRMLGQPLFQCSVMSNTEMDAAPSPVAQAPAQAGEVAPTWGYAKTVGNAIAQLQTMDRTLPFYAALHLQDGRCIARGVTFSRERVVNERWIDNTNKDVPYSIVVWSQPVESLYATPPSQPVLAPVVREPLSDERIDQLFLDAHAEGYGMGWQECGRRFARAVIQATTGEPS